MLGVIVLLTASRVWLSAHLSLTPDEAYYWLWSRHPALSYFDHPPLTAWFMAAFTGVLGTSTFTVRLAAHVCLGASAVLVWAAARDLTGRAGAGVTAVFLLSAAPLFGALGFLITPDAPLILFFSATLFAWGRLSATGRGPWWLVLGASVGLGFLGKYTMLLILPALFLWVMISARGRRWLLTPWPYLSGLTALAGALPVLIWNANHDWISVAFQAGHGLGRGGGLSPAKLAEFLGGQAGVISPLLFGAILAAAGVLLWRGWRDRRDGWLILGLACLIPMAFFALTALFGQKTQANWPAPAYLAGALAAAALANGKWWRRALGWGAVVGLAVIAVIAVHLVRPFLPIPAADDRAFEFRMRPVGRQVGRALPRQATPVFLLSDEHQLLAAAAFYGAPRRPAVDLTRPWRYWYVPRLLDFKGWDALLLTRWPEARVRRHYRKFCRSIRLRGRFALVYRGKPIQDYTGRIYLLKNFSGAIDYWLGRDGWPMAPRSRRTSPRVVNRVTAARP
jgi:hypothetical protein